MKHAPLDRLTAEHRQLVIEALLAECSPAEVQVQLAASGLAANKLPSADNLAAWAGGAEFQALRREYQHWRRRAEVKKALWHAISVEGLDAIAHLAAYEAFAHGLRLLQSPAAIEPGAPPGNLPATDPLPATDLAKLTAAIATLRRALGTAARGRAAAPAASEAPDLFELAREVDALLGG